MPQERLKELGQTATPKELHSTQSRQHQQKSHGVVHAASRDEYNYAGGSKTEGGDDMAD